MTEKCNREAHARAIGVGSADIAATDDEATVKNDEGDAAKNLYV